jgi:hypothetical protein
LKDEGEARDYKLPSPMQAPCPYMLLPTRERERERENQRPTGRIDCSRVPHHDTSQCNAMQSEKKRHAFDYDYA